MSQERSRGGETGRETTGAVGDFGRGYGQAITRLDARGRWIGKLRWVESNHLPPGYEPGELPVLYSAPEYYHANAAE